MNKKLQATAGPDGGCYGDYNAAPVCITPNQTVTFSSNSTDVLVFEEAKQSEDNDNKKLCVPASEDTGACFLL